ncbi:MAG: tetratricopeptide repeat protein [Prevotella sp.]|jgi:tetratricopeptide (TPR) repeat protein|nr:tetratricopeptide repeat protein [Prevotella sp.]
MNSQEILNKKKEILFHLAKRQLKDAVETLTQLAVNLQNWQISEKLGELETNYKFMLHYQFEAENDPDRQSVYFGLIRTLYELADDVSGELLMSVSSAFFYEKSRIKALYDNADIPEYHRQLKELTETVALTGLLEDGAQKNARLMELAVKRERTASSMFMAVYLSARASEEEYGNYVDFLGSPDLNGREKCLFVSAITLNLMHCFDARKMRLLLSFATDENHKISQRVIVGLIVILQMYDVRWTYYPECRRQLEALSENDYFRQSVVTVVKQLIRSRETEKISKIMTEEIIPEMLKFNSLAGKKLNMEDLMGETDFAEKNPEWKRELEDSGLAGKLQEYSDMQMNGSDVFHATFANLKTFPFFNDISNWFLFFDQSYSELQPLFNKMQKDSLLQMAVINSGHICDSDKYSFCFSLMQIPESQVQVMLHRFSDESDEMKQLQKEASVLNKNVGDEIISNQYIQSLYRFFKLFRYKSSFFDIFRLKLNFYEKKTIAPLISENKTMRQIASYCFEKNFLQEALDIYLILAADNDEDSDVWQKIGYCRQMLNDMQGALDAYLHADLIRPDNSWTIKRIAQMYRSLKQPGLALEYYLKLQTLTTANIANELNIGHCYLDMGDCEKALNAYFKVELLDGGDNPKAWRPVAWTAFLLKRFDLSRQYYQKILAAKPTEHDYLNAGHVELVLNNRKAALNNYLQALYLLDNRVDEFISLFEADRQALIEAGVDENFFPLLFDELKYKID